MIWDQKVQMDYEAERKKIYVHILDVCVTIIICMYLYYYYYKMIGLGRPVDSMTQLIFFFQYRLLLYIPSTIYNQLEVPKD